MPMALRLNETPASILASSPFTADEMDDSFKAHDAFLSRNDRFFGGNTPASEWDDEMGGDVLGELQSETLETLANQYNPYQQYLTGQVHHNYGRVPQDLLNGTPVVGVNRSKSALTLRLFQPKSAPSAVGLHGSHSALTLRPEQRKHLEIKKPPSPLSDSLTAAVARLEPLVPQQSQLSDSHTEPKSASATAYMASPGAPVTKPSSLPTGTVAGLATTCLASLHSSLKSRPHLNQMAFVDLASSSQIMSKGTTVIFPGIQSNMDLSQQESEGPNAMLSFDLEPTPLASGVTPGQAAFALRSGSFRQEAVPTKPATSQVRMPPYGSVPLCASQVLQAQILHPQAVRVPAVPGQEQASAVREPMTSQDPNSYVSLRGAAFPGQQDQLPAAFGEVYAKYFGLSDPCKNLARPKTFPIDFKEKTQLSSGVRGVSKDKEVPKSAAPERSKLQESLMRREQTKERNREHAKRSRDKRKLIGDAFQLTKHLLHEENKKLRKALRDYLGDRVTDELLEVLFARQLGNVGDGPMTFNDE